MHLEERQRGESNREYAKRMLKDNIVQLHLEPGSLIGEQEIARELGMSRTPVREAIMELAKSKIVEVMPQKGIYVSYLDYDLIEEARFLRMTLELALVDEIVEKATEDDFARMEANVAMQRFYLQRADQLKLLELDNEFHRIFFEICHKMQCYAIMKDFGIHFDRVRFASLEDVRDNKTVQDHEDMVQMFRHGDVDRVKNILKVHLSRFQTDKAKIQAAHGDYFRRNAGTV